MPREKRPVRVSLFVKFAVCIMLVGIVPVGLLVTVMQNRMVDTYRASLRETYEEALSYAAYSIGTQLDACNNLSKFCFFYDYSSDGVLHFDYKRFDTLRSILTGEAFPEEENLPRRIEQEMSLFLHYLNKTDATIEATHFLYVPEGGQPILYHRGNYTNTLFDDERFLQAIRAEEIDRESRKLLLFPTHSFDYTRVSDGTKNVLTVGRNYYDLTRAIGQERYVGTLLIDLNLREFNNVFEHLELSPDSAVYVVDEDGNCFFSTDASLIGAGLRALDVEFDAPAEEGLLLSQQVEGYGLTIWLRLSGIPIETQLKSIRNLMYLCIFSSLAALLIGSIFFSRRLTRPIRTIMNEMAQVETGQFKHRIPVTSNDELGELTARFNRMTEELEHYTNQVYVARIQQTEAELTALKSQIYPHFLYNTLEVIRMTALSRQDEMVGRMVEALSDQIRYLIGTVSDVVPLRSEVDILEKYIYLINCRFDNKVEFQFSCDALMDVEIPKLVLQPLVENAFIHGIKPMQGSGRIRLTAQRSGGDIELTVMDNGVGMTAGAVRGIEALLQSDQPGRKNEYQWESIGLKNVHDRMRFLYGPGYGISLFSTPGMGTVIKVTIPGDLQNKPATEKGEDACSA
ncbi:MAG: sensor histidine kinase [Subdoligranulum sp.]|nr:sensor histidine kinase [Subdoligranulum sp.]